MIEFSTLFGNAFLMWEQSVFLSFAKCFVKKTNSSTAGNWHFQSLALKRMEYSNNLDEKKTKMCSDGKNKLIMGTLIFHELCVRVMDDKNYIQL